MEQFIDQLSKCDECGIWWMPSGGDPGCPMCKMKESVEAGLDQGELVESLEASVKDLQEKMDKAKVKAKRREKVIIELRKKVSDYETADEDAKTDPA